MIRIEPLGTNVVLPAVVVGYEVPDVEDEVVENLDPEVPWILTLDQQAGGLAMSYPSVVGIVLRLASNLDQGTEGAEQLIDGLRFMAQDPEIEVLRRDYPVLAELVATHGEPYTEKELRDLHERVHLAFRLPTFSSGLEAFVRCEDCDPMDYLEGWRAMSATVSPERPPRTIYKDKNATYIEESNIADLTIDDDRRLDRAAIDELTARCGHLTTTTRPQVFLLWGNSD